MRLRPALLTLSALVLLLPAGCASSSSAQPAGDSSSAATRVKVVASTDVWGDIAAQIGGAGVEVTSIISDPNADPHSYQASAKVQLALSKAALVIENGGGYDDFVDTMLASLATKPAVINAVDVSGFTAAAGEDVNEHVWYDFPTVTKVADQIAARLTGLAPADSATFQANLATFDAKVAAMGTRAAQLRTTVAGKGVAITEPVPVYLLNALGLVNKTPEAFSKAIEDGTDVPASVMADTLALYTSHQVAALVYNEQTTGPQTEQVLAAAKAAGVAVVPVTETLPNGKDYITWMTANLDALAAALAG